MSFARLIAPIVTAISIIFAPIKSRLAAFWHRLAWAVLEKGC